MWKAVSDGKSLPVQEQKQFTVSNEMTNVILVENGFLDAYSTKGKEKH